MIVAVTGHRPQDCEPEEIVRQKLRTAFRYNRVSCVIVGMAAGVDLWAGDEALGLGIPIWCAKPWAGHSPRKEDEDLYRKLIANAEKVVNVTEFDEYPGPWCYHKRNEWMVDNATHVLAYWNGKESGGTYACRNYAKNKAKKPVKNIYHAAPF